MGSVLFRHRLAVILVFFVAGLACAAAQGALGDDVWTLLHVQPRGDGFLASGLVCLVAFALRVAGEARLGTAVYAQGETARLVDDGIFAHTRNPLYIGTWLFFVALVSSWAPAWAWGVLSLAFVAALHAIVRHEEQLLSSSLGAPYLEYLTRVPRWWPSLRARTAPSTVTSTSRPSSSIASAVWGNLGLLGFAVFRIGVALHQPARLLGALNLLVLAVWVVVVVVRRARA